MTDLDRAIEAYRLRTDGWTTAKVDALLDGYADPMLHVVLDDSNLGDEFIDSAIDVARAAHRMSETSEQRHRAMAAFSIARLLRSMTMPQRLGLASVCDCGCVDRTSAEIVR